MEKSIPAKADSAQDPAVKLVLWKYTRQSLHRGMIRAIRSRASWCRRRPGGNGLDIPKSGSELSARRHERPEAVSVCGKAVVSVRLRLASCAQEHQALQYQYTGPNSSCSPPATRRARYILGAVKARRRLSGRDISDTETRPSCRLYTLEVYIRVSRRAIGPALASLRANPGAES
jgi:hypothetical protein